MTTSNRRPPNEDGGNGVGETTASVRRTELELEFRYVDTHPTRQVVRAVVTHADGVRHAVGHLPSEGWWCECPAGKRCRLIDAVRQLVPGITGST